MEGDAGTSRLNPTDADDPSSTEVTPEDSSESGGGTDQTGTVVTPEDSSESEGGTDSTEVTAESAVEPGVEDEELPAESTASEDDASPESVSGLGPSRLGRRWFLGIAVVLLLLAGGAGAGGLFALRFHQDSQTIARNEAAAIKAAQDCVAATQAPDINAMATAAAKMVDCSTGDFGAQAALYSGLLAEAYQAANAQVQVSDMRAAVLEPHDADGTIEVLVALRTKVINSESKGQEQGYRLHVWMTLADGQYKISKLEQVTK